MNARDEQDPRLDYLTDRDRRILRTIVKENVGWYSTGTYSFNDARTLPALVGHSLIFAMSRRDQQLELVSYPVELASPELKGGYDARYPSRRGRRPFLKRRRRRGGA